MLGSDSCYEKLPVGTPSFFPALLTEIRNELPNYPIDPAILQAILLCLISGDKHLILRTQEEDISLAVKLAALILTSIYGFVTHKLRVKPKASRFEYSQSNAITSFLRSLFIISSSMSGSFDENSAANFRRFHKRSKRNTSRSRSRSYTASSLPYARPAGEVPASHTHNPFADGKPSVRPMPTAVSVCSSSRAFDRSQLLPHSASDPTPIRVSRENSHTQLPNALVISGLENSATSSQIALAQVLSDRRLVLEGASDSENEGEQLNRRRSASDADRTPLSEQEDIEGLWNLPSDFIVIYVCSMDPRERPAVHKSLLDRFAMSATVTLTAHSRNLAATFFHSYRSPPLTTSSSGFTPTSTPPYGLRPLPHPHQDMSDSLIISSSLLRFLRATSEKAHLSPQLSLYLADLFTAARHHPQLEGRLLTARTLKDAEDLARSWRVLGADPTGIELIQASSRSFAPSELPETDTSAGQSQDSFNLSPFAEDIGNDTVLIELPVSDDGHRQREDVPTLDVTEADIARVVPRVMSHRLRVRDGPECEVLGSLMFPAADPESGEGDNKDRSTVKDVLVKILSDV